MENARYPYQFKDFAMVDALQKEVHVYFLHHVHSKVPIYMIQTLTDVCDGHDFGLKVSNDTLLCFDKHNPWEEPMTSVKDIVERAMHQVDELVDFSYEALQEYIPDAVYEKFGLTSDMSADDVVPYLYDVSTPFLESVLLYYALPSDIKEIGDRFNRLISYRRTYEILYTLWLLTIPSSAEEK